MRKLYGLAACCLTLTLAACGGPAEVQDDLVDSVGQAQGGKADAPTNLSHPAFASGDGATLAQVLAGRLPAYDGLQRIAFSGGFPVKTAKGYLFAIQDDGSGPYTLAGDATGWKQVAMKNWNGVWWALVPVSRPAGSRYKFVDGEGTWGADPYARSYGFDENGQYSLVQAQGAHLERWPNMSGNGLAPRHVRVWVPAQKPTHHLYVHDGQNLFDPESMGGGWRLQDSLGKSTLAIGIDNTPDRMDEYTHVQDEVGGEVMGGKGDAYADFVDGVVRPFIESRYGTARKVGVMGSSLGGLISFHIALRKPGRYDFAASLSGTFGWGSMALHNQTLIERWARAGHQKTALYLDSGGDDAGGCYDSDGDGIQDDNLDAGDNFCETRQMADTLASVGYVWDRDLFHWHEPGAEHNEAYWADRVWRPLGIFEKM